MRILMLSWEYPPVVVGGLGRHVHALARKLAGQGHEVAVLCRQHTGSDASTHPTTDAWIDGVRVLRGAEVAHLFEVEPETITVLHNGIESRRWKVRPAEVSEARRRHGSEDAPLLLFFGRLEWEKGVQDLIAALPRIRRSHPGTRLVVA